MALCAYNTQNNLIYEHLHLHVYAYNNWNSLMHAKIEQRYAYAPVIIGTHVHSSLYIQSILFQRTGIAHPTWLALEMKPKPLIHLANTVGSRATLT